MQSDTTKLAQLLKEWEVLLAMEAREAAGEDVKPLQCMHWRLNSVTRLGFLAQELDALSQQPLSTEGAGIPIMKACTQHLFDSAIVENTHQGAKDIMKDARHNFRSRVHKMHAVINTAALQSRDLNHVKATETIWHCLCLLVGAVSL